MLKLNIKIMQQRITEIEQTIKTLQDKINDLQMEKQRLMDSHKDKIYLTAIEMNIIDFLDQEFGLSDFTKFYQNMDSDIYDVFYNEFGLDDDEIDRYFENLKGFKYENKTINFGSNDWADNDHLITFTSPNGVKTEFEVSYSCGAGLEWNKGVYINV